MANNEYDDDYSFENDYVREPDKPIRERLVDNGQPYFSDDEILEIFRELHKAEGEERNKIKKFIKDNKLDHNNYYDKDSINYNSTDENNNLYATDMEFEIFLKQNGEQYLEEQYLADQMVIIKKLENDEMVKRNDEMTKRNDEMVKINDNTAKRNDEIVKRNKLIENKKIKLDKLILKITNILKFSANNDDSVILYILNNYIENFDEYILLSELEFNIFSNYLKKNYKDLYLLNRRTFLDRSEHDFLDSVIKLE